MGMEDIDQKREENRNFLRAWREHWRLTQDQLGELAGTTGSVIHLLEAGDRPLSPKWLRRLAPALKTTPGYLLDYHPDDVGDVMGAWLQVPQERRPQALEVLKTFTKSGTGG